MKYALLLGLLPLSLAAAEHEHDHGGQWNQFWMLERFEQQRRDGQPFELWDAQGWLGTDYRKLWLKSEGHGQVADGAVDTAEVQVLFSRALAPFWDWQAGLRHDAGEGPSRDYAVLGLQGLAPYWFEVDAALFVAPEASHLRLDADYDLRLSQRWILQPRLQLNLGIGSTGQSAGAGDLFDSSIALRLRYEIVREFAPYLGVEREIGGHRTGDDTRVVAGVRLWY